MKKKKNPVPPFILTPLRVSSQYNGWFVDLFVRASNFRAREMYESFGYVPFRRVLGYYSGEEDAWDYRKLLERDKDGFSCIPLEKAIEPEELEW